MKKQQIFVAALAFSVFLIGSAFIVYNGRPAAKMNNDAIPTAAAAGGTDAQGATTDSATDSSTAGSGNVFTMADVTAHAVKNDCWSAINGSVYDLTTWVSRHPGGESAIMRLCGTDGSATFNRKHGTMKPQQNALALLKIGTLK